MQFAKNFILVYSYDNRLTEEWLICAIKQLAKEEGKTIIAIGGYLSWCDENISPDPFVAMKYFETADYVITDTFHGSLLSIKFKRKFVSMIRDQNSNKLIDLLRTFELTDRILDTPLANDKLKNKLEEKCNWNKVDIIIQESRVKANEYLKKHIRTEKKTVNER